MEPLGAILLQRNRLMVVTALTFIASVVFIVVTMKTTLELRLRQAMARHRVTARLTAQLIDEQCRLDSDRLRRAADRHALAGSLRSGSVNGSRAILREIVDSMPDLAAASLHQRNGSAVASFGGTANSEGRGGRRPWFLDPSAASAEILASVVRRSAEPGHAALAIAVPLGGVAHPTGYLVGYFPVDPSRLWLPHLERGDAVAVTLVDGHGTILAEAAAPGATRDTFQRARLVPQALKSPDTSLLLPSSGKAEESVAAFARVGGPRWRVLVVEPARVVQTPILVPFACLLIFMVILCLFALVGVRNFLRLYRRQEVLRATLVEQNRHLKILDEAKSQFLSNVSHDLWTPLAGMEVSLSGLLDPTIAWTPQQVRESLQLANHELMKMIDRVRNLLELARLDANSDMAQKEPCDLVDIVGAALERLASLLKGRTLYADFPPVPLMVNGAHTQLEIVVMNLLDNAIKYSPPDSPLTLKGERRGSDVYVSLRDCGPGVAPHDFERIFEKFYRGEMARNIGGSGVGLAICKAVVERHGGVIGVLNLQGGGAEFWFSIPGLPKERLE